MFARAVAKSTVGSDNAVPWYSLGMKPDLEGMIRQGRGVWNVWREHDFSSPPDERYGRVSLRGADLQGLELTGFDFLAVDFTDANLEGSHLSYSSLSSACFHRANLREAVFEGTDVSLAIFQQADLTKAYFGYSSLVGADMSMACLRGADLECANLRGVNLRGSDLSGASLECAVLVDTDLTGATLAGCSVYGISAWNLQLEGTKQTGLNISRSGDAPIRVDNLEVAQFIHLILKNEKLRTVIDELTSKCVLVLGRFSPEVYPSLEVIARELREAGYSPIIFDFEKPQSRTLTETVRILAHLSAFVVCDLTDPRSIPQELQAIVPELKVPIQPVIRAGNREYGMFQDFRAYPWVLELHRYQGLPDLADDFRRILLCQLEAKRRDLLVAS
jgi:uncharacterized protein YjbI with pentapeptide repeats